jgi:hypothetical protein
MSEARWACFVARACSKLGAISSLTSVCWVPVQEDGCPFDLGTREYMDVLIETNNSGNGTRSFMDGRKLQSNDVNVEITCDIIPLPIDNHHYASSGIPHDV